MKRLLTLIFLSLVLTGTTAQTIEPKHTFNLELGLPNGMTNEPFKDIMQGLVSVAPYYQYAFKNHIIVGAGVRYSYFAINEFKVPVPVYGGMHTGGAFIKAGWEKFHNDHFATDLSMKVGYTQNYFDTDRNDTLGVNPVVNNSFYFEPSIGLILTADEQNSFRFIVAYGIQGFGYKPEMIGLETFGGYDPIDFSKPSSMLIVGFGFTHYFKKKS
jgi:hypothetical protein